jgi:hypothetical protein
MFREPDSQSPRNVTAVILMSRRYDIWGLPVFGRADDSLSWWSEKDEGGTLKLVVRGNKAGPSAQGMSNNDHRVALTVDFS